MDVDARLEALQAENERLRERVLHLEEQIGQRIENLYPPEWRLTRSEARVFGTLLRRDACTKEGIMAALYTGGADDEPEIKIVDVYVYKLRKKIKPFGIEIETIWGQGYRMTPAAKAVARALIEPEAEAA